MDATSVHAGAQIGSTFLTVGLIQWLKTAPWFTWLKEGQVAKIRAVSMIAAAGTTLGIHLTIIGSAAAGGTFSGSFPSVWTMAIALFHWAAQYSFNEGGYTVVSIAQNLSGILAHLQGLPAAGPQQAAPPPVAEPAKQ